MCVFGGRGGGGGRGRRRDLVGVSSLLLALDNLAQLDIGYCMLDG